ncbi:isochorismate synthase, partial [Providencia rettgeri]|nr:isochorismate synthase [Providencia rettgeri]
MNSRIADHVRPATIEEWLQHYQADSSVFASPTVSLMAHGTALERHTHNAQG